MSKPLRVLMIEDSEDACIHIAEELQKHGYTPHWRRVDNAPAMREAWAAQAWDVIIADYVVPGFNALSSVKAAQELGSDLPFLVVSGNLGEEVAVAVMKAGAHDYVTKGNLTRLVPAIERELRETATRRGRRQAEAALERKEALSRTVLDSLSAEIAVLDKDGRIAATNAAWELSGRRLADSNSLHPPVGSNYLEVFASTLTFVGGDKVLAGIRGVLEGSLPDFAAEYPRPLASGTGWFLLHATPLVNYGGAVVSHLDLTERRQAREALRKSQAGLLLAQRIGHVGSWELDVPTGAMEWSAETYRIFDVGSEGAAPTFDLFVQQFADADQARIRNGFAKAQAEGSYYRTDCCTIRADGSQRIVHLQAQLIVNESDQSVQMLGTVQDISERKLLEEQLRRSQKMDAVGQLAGGIAHDFNNILTVIQGYTELIACQPHLAEPTRGYTEQIAQSAERASRLTRQLLTFSRKQVLQLTSLDVNGLVKNLAAMLQRLLGEQIQFHCHLQAQLPVVLADSSMLEQVLVNLVVNARDAMPKGGRLLIETSLHQIDPDYCRIHPDAMPGTFICLGVIDTGSGIDPRIIDHVFEPFFTTKEVGRGTGLGLPTVYGIIKQHHGWIQVASEFGRGTAFKVFLPLGAVSTFPSERLGQNTLVRGGTETILLAEDEPLLRQLARSILERYGYRVLEAGSGPEALAAWDQFSGQIDMLLTDMVMPGGMTGRELALNLQSKATGLRVLYTSGYSLEFVESNLLLREGVNFVPKPYSGTSLGQAVRACLDRKA